jgi:hypothetical protein
LGDRDAADAWAEWARKAPERSGTPSKALPTGDEMLIPIPAIRTARTTP